MEILVFILIIVCILGFFSTFKSKTKRQYKQRKSFKKNARYYKKKQEINHEKQEKRKILIGVAYELQIADYYRKIGYQVQENGLNMGVRDGGIDLICTKNNELLLVQCKNWQKKVLQLQDVDKFIKNFSCFVNNLSNDEKKGKRIKRVFVISCLSDEIKEGQYKGVLIKHIAFDEQYSQRVDYKKITCMYKDKNTPYIKAA